MQEEQAYCFLFLALSFQQLRHAKAVDPDSANSNLQPADHCSPWLRLRAFQQESLGRFALHRSGNNRSRRVAIRTMGESRQSRLNGQDCADNEWVCLPPNTFIFTSHYLRTYHQILIALGMGNLERSPSIEQLCMSKEGSLIDFSLRQRIYLTGWPILVLQKVALQYSS